jgi:hypothetical protein
MWAMELSEHVVDFEKRSAIKSQVLQTISVLNLAIFPMLLKSAAQKLKKIWDSLMRSSRPAIITGRLSVELWSLSAAISSRVFDLVLCKTLFV